MISSKFDISLIFISIDIIMDLYRNFNKENQHIQMISSKFDISLIFISRNNSNIIIDSIYIGILTKLTSISSKFDISLIFISIDIIMDLYRNFNKENQHIQMISSKFDISLIFISRNNSNIIIDSIYIGILTKSTSNDLVKIRHFFDFYPEKSRNVSNIIIDLHRNGANKYV